MSNQKIEIDNNMLNINSSNNTRMHEITILYLQSQDISKLTIAELSKKYVDTYYEISNSIADYKRASRHTLN